MTDRTPEETNRIDELEEENAALKNEISRLNAVLENRPWSVVCRHCGSEVEIDDD